jgi:hypothetical protein
VPAVQLGRLAECGLNWPDRLIADLLRRQAEAPDEPKKP